MGAGIQKFIGFTQLDTNKLKERRGEISRELTAILERNTSGVLNTDDKARFDVLERESADIKTTIERAERVAVESVELKKFTPVAEPNINIKDEYKEQYSIARAIRLKLDNKPIDGLEGEISQEISRQCGVSPRGFFIPTGSLSWGKKPSVSRAFDSTQGAKLVTQEWLGYIEYLRNKSALGKTGATFLNGLQGLINLPRKTATSTAYWVAEGNAPIASAPNLTTSTQLSPKTVGAYCDLTRSLVAQTSYDVEAMIRDDLVKTIALEVDRVALVGTGANNQPTGLLYNTSISSRTMAADTGNGGAASWADIVAMESAVGSANADVGNLSYLVNSVTRGKLKQTPKIGTTFPQFLWADDNTVNGYPAYVSNQLASNYLRGSSSACSAMIFGNWDDLIVGFWGGLDINIDPYSLSTSGGLRLVALQNVDIAVRNFGSFCIAPDVRTD